MTEIIVMAAAQPRRDELRRLLSTDPSIHVAGTATTFAVLRSLIDTTAAHVALIEVASTADTQIVHDWLIDILGRIPTIVLMPAPDAATFNAIMDTGEGGLLHTDASFDQLIQAIRSVCAGLLIFDKALTPQPDVPDRSSEQLTARETEVLSLLAEGLANREIAVRLDISEHTIKFHIRSILAKLGASTRTEAVTRGLRYGLIEL